MRHFTLLTTLVLGFSVASGASAQDWTQFRGSNRDNKVEGFKVPDTWPTELTQKWKTEVGLGEASPLLVGERIYAFGRIGENEVALCLNAATGEEMWKDEYPAERVGGGARQHPGPRGTPAVGEGKMVTLGVDGQLTCYNAADGEVVWRKDSSDFPDRFPRFFTGASPMIAGGLAISFMGSEQSGALVAYDLNSGDEKWKWNRQGASYGSPVAMDLDGRRLVVTLAANGLVGVDAATGEEVWFHDLPAQQHTGTPVIHDNMAYVGTRENGVTAIAIEKDGDAYSTKQAWANGPGARYTSPMIKDGLIYGASSQGVIYCLDAMTGEEKWSDNSRRGDPAALIDAGDVILAVTSNSELAVIEPGGDELKEVAKFKVADSAVWSYPIIAGNRVFVKDENSVILWTLQ